MVRWIPHRLAVYDIYDDHAEYDYVRTDPRRQAYSRAVERQLLDSVDLAFAVSYKLVRDKAGTTPMYYLPNGVDIELAQSVKRAPEPAELHALPRPIVGYLGSYDSRLDWNLVEGMAGARPGWSFVFVGGGYTSPRRRHPNLHLLGNRSYPEALRYVNAFDLALIPFVRDRLTDAVCPAKLFDYLALGKPVLSTPLPAVCEIAGEGPEVYRGSTVEDFLRNADRALHEAPDAARAREALAASLTWEVRADRAMNWIGERLAQIEGRQ
jgi:UDP-galactopyranose mutase